MVARVVFFIMFSVLFFAYLPYWIWTVGRWFSGTGSLIHLLIVGVLLMLGWQQKIWRHIQFRKTTHQWPLLVAALVIGIERLQHGHIAATILSVILILIALWCLCAGFLRCSLSNSRLIVWSTLSFCALPILPLLGSTIGIITRQLYTETVWLLFSSLGADIQKHGTSLVSQHAITHIDSACSGVQGIFLLTVASLFVYLLKKHQPSHFLSLLAHTLLLYILLNGVRIFVIVFLHNILLFDQVFFMDSILSTIALGVSASWMFAILYKR